jgi:hypothetical protein
MPNKIAFNEDSTPFFYNEKEDKSPHLTYRYLKNVVISLGGLEAPVGCEIKEMPTNFTEMGKRDESMPTAPLPPGPNGELRNTARGSTAVPVFDVGPHSTAHTLPLFDETVYKPHRPAKMSERRFEELQDDAYKLASENTTKNNRLREALRRYIDEGIIELVDDPYGALSANAEPLEVVSEMSGMDSEDDDEDEKPRKIEPMRRKVNAK